jgi:DNA transposition AAA+ family ATPase
MIKGLFWIAVGAAGALEAQKWLEKRKAQLSPNALTGRLLETANARLEQGRARSAAVPGSTGDSI